MDIHPTIIKKLISICVHLRPSVAEISACFRISGIWILGFGLNRPGLLPLLLVALLPLSALALTNNLALTPPMGWNSWNHYGCNVSDSIIRGVANAMTTNGMQAAGYQFVNLDDCWQVSRDTNGVIVPDPTRFPYGIKALADYVHSKGLKLGVYSDHGLETCAGRPGGYGYEYIDACTYAAWGVDYLKYDNCNLPSGDVSQTDYARMADALMKSGRPITFSLCHWSFASWEPLSGNLWRTTGDINDSFASMVSNLSGNSPPAYAAGPGRWNDPDMLEVGNGGMTSTEDQSHFSLWCLVSAPLIAGNDVTGMSAQTFSILTNAELIAVDQDPSGEQGVALPNTGTNQIWVKSLGTDFTTKAVGLFNPNTNAATITVNWTNVGLLAGSVAVRDMWAGANLGVFTNSFTTNVPPHGVVALKLVGLAPLLPALGTNYLSALQPVYGYVGWGTQNLNKSIGGNSITLNGKVYAQGLGVHAFSGVEYRLGGVASRLQSDIGVDNEAGSNGSVVFHVLADGVEIFTSGVLTGGAPHQSINLDVTGVNRLTLGVSDADNGNGYDHADWAGALVIVTNSLPQAPETPVGLMASPGSAITLTWSNTLAALTYNVKRSTVSGGGYTNIANVPITTFTDSNVFSGTTYYYVVSAVSSLGEGSNSLAVVAAPCSPPAVPVGVTATGAKTQVVVSWNVSAGATGYNLSRFTSGTPPVVVATGLMATTFTDSNVVSGAIYYYLVAATNGCGQSGFAAFVPAIIAPAAPTGLTAVGGDDDVSLNWNASVGASAYNIKRSTTNGGPYQVISSNLTAASYTDFYVLDGTTYYYVVSAVNAGGESANSAPASAMPTSPLTACWTNTATTAAQDWNANANWTNVAAFPNSSGEMAVINANLSAPQTINLNQAITIGSLQIGAANGAASYTLAANGGSLTFSDTNPVVLTQLPFSHGDVIAAPVTLTTNLIVINDSTNPFTFAGTLSSSGGVLTLGSGTLIMGDGTTNGSLGSVSVSDYAALIFNRGDSTLSVTGVISGSGSVANNGSGTVTLAAVETYTGPTIVNAGTLAVSAPNQAKTGISTSSGLIINSGGTFKFISDNAGFGTGTAQVPVTINAGGTLTGSATADSGAGTSSHLAGLVTLNGGVLTDGGTQIQITYGTWDLDGGVAVNGGTNTSIINCLDVIPSESSGTIFNVAAGGTPSGVDLLVTGTFINGSNIHDTGIIKTGAGTMVLDANNAYAGGTTISAGTLQLGAAGDASLLTSPLGTGAVADNATLSLAGGQGVSVSVPISGTGALMAGSGTNTLSATNTFTGATAVNAGVLILTNHGALMASAIITVAAGAALDASKRTDQTLTLNSGQTLTGSGTLKGSVIVGSGAMLAPGNPLGTLKFSNNLTLNGGSTTALALDKALLTNAVAQVAGVMTYGGTLALTNLGGTLAAGDTFKLFNAPTHAGSFTNFLPVIPAVNLAWNTNTLSSGTLGVVSQPTAPPRFGRISAGGNRLVFSGSNGVANWPYLVLTSSNLALPMNQWPCVATNVFDPSGNFNFTNVPNLSAPPLFYRLQLQ